MTKEGVLRLRWKMTIQPSSPSVNLGTTLLVGQSASGLRMKKGQLSCPITGMCKVVTGVDLMLGFRSLTEGTAYRLGRP